MPESPTAAETARLTGYVRRWVEELAARTHHLPELTRRLRRSVAMPEAPVAIAKFAPASRRLVVVSNRTAAPGEPRAGGLAVAVSDALAERGGGLWFGWSGRLSEANAHFQLLTDGTLDYALTDLSPAEHAGYYLGYANRVLWPLLHYRVDLAEFDEAAYASYAEVNRRFARMLAPLLRPDDLVWVHDYHLLLLGRELRAAGWPGVTGFFLHVPFPAPEMFATLPQHAELGQALAEFDLVGFQTERHVENFRNYLIEFLGASAHGDGLLTFRRRSIRVAAFPVGIDHDEFAALADCRAARKVAARLRHCVGDRTLVLGADRLDYTKGLPQRLRGFERLLRDNPDLQRRVSLLQIASPSRSELPAYGFVRTEVERMAGRINGAYGDLDWTPVQHVSRFYPREVLGGFCRVARVGLITSLHDGMNLVAKEYVAAQDPADPGVLVLSRFAGAADQLGAALIVNPHDPEDVAAAVRQAIRMPKDERRRRWEALDASVRHEDAAWWQRSFLAALQTARPSLLPLPRQTAGGLATAV